MNGGRDGKFGRRGPLSWWFEDRTTGRLVIAQMPNTLLWVFILSWTAEKVLHPAGTTGRILPFVASASLALWSLDEIARGVNPWRRTLGAGALLGTAFSLVKRHG